MANDSSECKALNERGECNTDCPCADGIYIYKYIYIFFFILKKNLIRNNNFYI